MVCTISISFTRKRLTVFRSLDTIHTVLVMASTWYYFINHFGDIDIIDEIPWSVTFLLEILESFF